MESVEISLIITTLNEENTISKFLDSISIQTKRPDEVIFVDGGSSDKTVEIITNWAKNINNITIIVSEEVNIAQGRNIGILKSKYSYVAVSDAGCILHKSWLKEISEPFINDNSVDVVGGWYQFEKNNEFDSAISIIMEKNINEIDLESFLPSSRSIAYKKSAWQKIGGYPENLKKAAEDTKFNLNLKKSGLRFIFQPKAIVTWILPNNHKALFHKFYNYSHGDSEIKFNMKYYFLLSAYITLIVITIPLIFIISNFLFLYIFILLVYLLLPLIKKVNIVKTITFKEIVFIATCRITILFASVIGFYKGLIYKNEV